VQIDLGSSAGGGLDGSDMNPKGASRDGSELMRQDKKALEENLLLMQQKQRRLADQKKKAVKVGTTVVADQSTITSDKAALSEIKLTVHQPTKRAQATRNYRQQVGVGLFSHGHQAVSNKLHPTLASAGS